MVINIPIQVWIQNNTCTVNNLKTLFGEKLLAFIRRGGC